MTEVFVIRHFSTIFDSHGADQKSSLRQGMDLFTRLAVEGIDPTARAVKHIHCNCTGAGRSLPEGFTYCTELLRFISAHWEMLGYVLEPTFAGMCLYSVLVTGITNVVNQ